MNKQNLKILDEIFNYFNDKSKIYSIEDISNIKAILLTKYSENEINIIFNKIDNNLEKKLFNQNYIQQIKI